MMDAIKILEERIETVNNEIFRLTEIKEALEKSLSEVDIKITQLMGATSELSKTLDILKYQDKNPSSES